MIGFIVGSLSLYGLYRVRQGRTPALFRRSPQQMLPFVLRRLDTTPAQESVIVEALREAKLGAGGLQKEATMTKEDIVNMLQSETVEAEALGAAFARQDEALEDARIAAINSMRKIHGALSEEQRLQLARLIR